ncbi:SIMPL domain-containing protein [Neomegalonema perideroedes]|uniref:SIMPL domain-containing protein n=1 Tax=Neomegalonema perideroedes TaxID=217219 RepID=UPI000380F6F0|nr:SIMPL domain-containing protein [Neomegalonema perideroedes]
MSRFVFRPAALAAALAFSGLLAAPAAFADDRLISVSGEGSATAAPDLATVSVGVQVQAESAQEAVAQNATRMTAVFEALKAAGIEDKNVQTSNFSLGPRYEWVQEGQGGGGRQVLRGYEATNTVNVRLTDLSKVGPTLDALVGAGANQSAGVNFDIENRDELLKAARREAALNARAKAQEYAETLGVTLGKLNGLSEQVSGPSFPVVAFARAAAAPMAAPPTPIAGGEQSISVTVTGTWQIAD